MEILIHDKMPSSIKDPALKRLEEMGYNVSTEVTYETFGVPWFQSSLISEKCGIEMIRVVIDLITALRFPIKRVAVLTSRRGCGLVIGAHNYEAEAQEWQMHELKALATLNTTEEVIEKVRSKYGGVGSSNAYWTHVYNKYGYRT